MNMFDKIKKNAFEDEMQKIALDPEIGGYMSRAIAKRLKRRDASPEGATKFLRGIERLNEGASKSDKQEVMKSVITSIQNGAYKNGIGGSRELGGARMMRSWASARKKISPYELVESVYFPHHGASIG